eukprot:gnl/MRDRNA2_/MRDRNA2_86228_c0_seq1.p1 gnl/MRDRNA2_/MRDRNA2_86228_c0~~gnl/MRDRNA2_/MRDRNA2_86228_c0_seq1.p1  ORF type:complete len:406 (+),score=-19.85 gnl/MRDRNA2_/MRDRNA2_86228_c0_seq1:115-1332(+)
MRHKSVVINCLYDLVDENIRAQQMIVDQLVQMVNDKIFINLLLYRQIEHTFTRQMIQFIPQKNVSTTSDNWFDVCKSKIISFWVAQDPNCHIDYKPQCKTVQNSRNIIIRSKAKNWRKREFEIFRENIQRYGEKLIQFNKAIESFTMSDWKNLVKNNSFDHRPVSDYRVMWFSTLNWINFRIAKREEIVFLVCLTIRFTAFYWQKTAKALSCQRGNFICLKIWQRNYRPNSNNKKGHKRCFRTRYWDFMSTKYKFTTERSRFNYSFSILSKSGLSKREFFQKFAKKTAKLKKISKNHRFPKHALKHGNNRSLDVYEIERKMSKKVACCLCGFPICQNCKCSRRYPLIQTRRITLMLSQGEEIAIGSLFGYTYLDKIALMNLGHWWLQNWALKKLRTIHSNLTKPA